MAELVKTPVAFGAVSAPVAFTAATGSDFFIPDNADGRVFILAKNGGAQDSTVTIKAGDGSLAPLGNLSVPVAAGATVVIPLSRAESARVKLTTGADKGKIYLLAAANVSFGIVSVE